MLLIEASSVWSLCLHFPQFCSFRISYFTESVSQWAAERLIRQTGRTIISSAAPAEMSRVYFYSLMLWTKYLTIKWKRDFLYRPEKRWMERLTASCALMGALQPPTCLTWKCSCFLFTPWVNQRPLMRDTETFHWGQIVFKPLRRWAAGHVWPCSFKQEEWNSCWAEQRFWSEAFK